ncbi:hypothetical protein DFH08DRAFT_1090556 [Mycena albidolilacea]|uniref:Uncharacterized protein n=1 Tax=Mycena albidolilacea TaxID=1033008 RepID=A0AAD6YWG9_9AGAR|nr:hypothetical protein DFH08DRAFT_1090556 [Mycena albidolilacea]
MARRYSPFASPHYAAFSAHVRRTFPPWVISPTAVTTFVQSRATHLPYAIHRQRACKTQHIRCVALTLSRSFFPLPSPTHVHAHAYLHRSDPDFVPSCGPHHIERDFLIVRVALTVTANEAHCPSFAARSSRLLSRERGCDVINLFPSPLLSI